VARRGPQWGFTVRDYDDPALALGARMTACARMHLDVVW